MSGWDVLNELKQIEFTGKGVIIMATSSVDQSDKLKAKTFDCVIDFLENDAPSSCHKLGSCGKMTEHH